MAVKYRIEYTSVNDVDYRCDISNPDYVGDILPLIGRVVYEMPSLDNYYDPIRAKRLKINAIATVDQDLEDLLVEDERFFRVELFRGGNKIFFGYLSSELSQQTFGADRWELQVEALGPLGFLEDIAYDRIFVEELEKSTNPISRVIANCLIAGFQDQSEAFDIVQAVPYEVQLRDPNDLTFSTTSDNSFATQGLIDDMSFLDRDTETIKSCKDILTELLEALQLTITQVDGGTWHVIPYYADASTLPANVINSFDFTGSFVGTSSADLVPRADAVVHDSNTDVATEIIIAGDSNVYEYERSVDRITTNYKFEFRKILNDNAELLTRLGIIKVFDDTFDNTFGDVEDTGGFNLPFWLARTTVFGDQALQLTATGVELISRFRDLDQSSSLSSTQQALTSESIIRVVGGEKLALRVECTVLDNTADSPLFLDLFMRMQRDLGDEVFTLIQDNQATGNQTDKWFTVDELPDPIAGTGRVDINSGVGEKTVFTVQLPVIPDEDFSGLVEIVITSLGHNPSTFARVKMDFVGLDATDTTGDGTSTVFEKSKEGLKAEKFDLFYNSALGFILANQFYYDNQGVLNSVSGFQDIFNTRGDNFIPLSSIFSILRMNALQRRKIWTLNAYNFFEPNTLISIPANNVNPFRVIDYAFDTYANELRAELEEVTGIEVSGTITETILQDEDEPNSIN